MAMFNSYVCLPQGIMVGQLINRICGDILSIGTTVSLVN